MTISLRLRRKNHVKSPMAVKSIVSGFLAVAIVSSESQQRKLNPDESGFFRIRGSSALRVEAGKGSVADDMWSGVHIMSCPQAELREELAHGGPVNLGFCRSLGVSFDPPKTESPQSKDVDALELERLAQGMKELNKDECGLYEKDGAPNWRTVWIMRMWLGAIQLGSRAQISIEQEDQKKILKMSPNRKIELRIPVKMVMREAGPVVVYASTSTCSKKKISGPFLNCIEAYKTKVEAKLNDCYNLADTLHSYCVASQMEMVNDKMVEKCRPNPLIKLFREQMHVFDTSRKKVVKAFKRLREEERLQEGKKSDLAEFVVNESQVVVNNNVVEEVGEKGEKGENEEKKNLLDGDGAQHCA